ncbi:hypothetical protein SHKM778_65750 [Streptomyces sp. KM77-8]|uniref:Uncharacterized protein n=1 Tax=Streptomyces haneummycinicus TaxID=3074435 RepID=A0AAT9HS39_9ACTN
MVAAAPAVLLVDGQPEEADLAELLHDAAVDLLGAVPGGRVGRHLALHEVPGEPADVLLLLAELQIHTESPHGKAAETAHI